MKPLVSICMPHLNSRPFTEERMETILAQTLRDWELIIIDSNSDDGSKEILQRYAARDPRIRLSQGPRDGIYTNLNRTIEQSSGEYIYVATSDDTMSPQLLERLVNALEQNVDCGIAHCCLTTIDGNGRPLTGSEAWENWPAAQYFGDWIHKAHIRRAPHDGLLHFCLYTVYTSLTQLLVRRRVFDEFGGFRTDCSPHADFEWGMRAGLNQNIVHVPLALATWRRHSAQATQPSTVARARATGEFRRLRQEALRSLEHRNPKLLHALMKSRLNDYHLVSEFAARRALSPNKFAEGREILSFSIQHPIFALRWLFSKLVQGQSMTTEPTEAIPAEVQALGLGPLLQEIDLPSTKMQPLGAAVSAA